MDIYARHVEAIVSRLGSARDKTWHEFMSGRGIFRSLTRGNNTLSPTMLVRGYGKSSDFPFEVKLPAYDPGFMSEGVRGISRATADAYAEMQRAADKHWNRLPDNGDFLA